MNFGNKKLNAAVHYVCARCEDSSKLGAVKMNKTLLYTDLAHYLASGETLTGAKYKKLQYGPVPSEIPTAIMQLEAAGKIMTRNVDCYGYKRTEYISLQEPKLDDLEKDEVDLLGMMMDYVCNNHTASSISELSHDIVWEAAAMGEEIPMSAYLVSRPGNIDESDIMWAEEVVNKIGR